MKLSDNARAALNQVVERLKTGNIGEVVQYAFVDLPEGHPAKTWSTRNKMLAYLQAGTLDCRSYRAWLLAGRQVKKGAKAIFIFKPHPVLKEEDGEKRQVGMYFEPQPEFPVQDTEGETEIPFAGIPKELPPLAQVAAKLGIEVGYDATLYLGKAGMFNSRDNKITLGVADVKTWFHELGHAIHDRLEENGLKGGQHADQETVADLTGCVLASMYGYDYTGNTWEYIRRYNPDDPLKATLDALGTVEKVIAEIEKLAA